VRKGFRRLRRPVAGVRSARLSGERPLLRYVEDAEGRHNEAAWAGRLEEALTFLLG
jgi:hypothetical protein